jgi:DNA-binding MarR family transcriptional regulator
LRRAIVIVLDEPAASVNDMVSESKPKYTKKQGQYLAFIHRYTRVHNRPPAETDIQAFFGVTPPTVHQMVVRLEEKGLIRRVPRQARTIEVLVPPEQLPPLE